MAHPYAGQAKSSEKARLSRLTGKAGKSHGSSSMYFKSSYPGGAGTQREYTISGGGSKRRPDKLAGGGAVGGKKHRRPHSTTNIIISHAGGRGGSGGGGGAGPLAPQPPVPVPVNRPVPVPVAAGPVPGAGPRPPMPPPAPPVAGPPGPPPGGPPGGLPPGGVRPPGMKAGGGVKKAAMGKIGSKSLDQGKGYRGFPNSPTTEVDSAVSAHKTGGGVKKLQFGGPSFGGGANPMGAGGPQNTTGGVAGLLGNIPGRAPTPPIQGPPNISGRPARPAMPVTVPMPATASSMMARQAPGLGVTYSKRGGGIGKLADGGDSDKWKAGVRVATEGVKAYGKKRGGAVSSHSDEAEDKVLIKKEFKKRGLASGGIVRTPVTNATGGGSGAKARKAKTSAAKSEPGQTGSPDAGHNRPPRGMSGSKYHQQGKGTK